MGQDRRSTDAREGQVERIALVSDIHGNLPALEAVLADIDRRRIERVICLGDLAGKGPDGAKAVDICRERCEVVIRGNWDEGMVGDHPFLQWYRDELGPERCAWLGALPFHVDFALGTMQVRLVHASPQGVYNRVLPSASYDVHMAMFDNTPETGEGPIPDFVAYGDIHTVYMWSLRQKTLINVGSVGNPLDLTLATYAVLEAPLDPPGPVSVSLVRVPYDIERAIHDAVEAGMPELEAYAGELRTARYRHAPG
jgi:protein phosphatase